MQLWIDDKPVVAHPGENLLSLIKMLDLDADSLSKRPLAAKIAGEVFNLNYVPMREGTDNSERSSIRRAMLASQGKIHLLRYTDPVGRDVYERTAQYLVFLALYQLWPDMQATMNCTVGQGVFIEIHNYPSFCVEALKDKLSQLVKEDFPLVRVRGTTVDAIAHYCRQNRMDKARLLQWRKEAYYDYYPHGDYWEYLNGELMPSSGYLKVWDIRPAEGGFLFLYPDAIDPDSVAPHQGMPHFLSVFAEGERWCQLMECKNVPELNEMVCSGRIRELIRVNEALHEKRYAQIADMVCSRDAKVIMLAGPSSSGKTTSANRLATQLRVHGKKPVIISLDDYYLDRDSIPIGADGKRDLEHINTIDTPLFCRHMQQLLSGDTVVLPKFDFLTGKRISGGESLRLKEDTVLIVEGLHALNPLLHVENVPQNSIFRLYVNPMLPLNLDDHNRIASSYLRLLRRIVRDYENRGASVEDTMSMWNSVRRGERIWIYPFRETADVIFNSSTLYELPVLKKHIFPLLTAVEPESPYYEEVRGAVKILNYVLEADVDSEIPPTSLVREFIGGNTFYL